MADEWPMVVFIVVLSALGAFGIFIERSRAHEQYDKIAACITSGGNPTECRRAFTGDQP